MPTEYGVVGAGIIGLAVARQLLLSGATKVTVFDKETEVGQHQTGHNSGVAHAGIYYQPGSLKAELCHRGKSLLEAYCQEHDIAYDVRGKVVVARSEAELPGLRAIEARATANRVPGLRWLSYAELREIEPHVVGAAALHSPFTAIVDYQAMTRALAAEVEATGGELRLGSAVTGIRSAGSGVTVTTAAGSVTVDRLVVCAGLQADRVAQLAGDEASPAIVPFRGEYYRLLPGRQHLTKGLVYPVPDPAYPFLGVHFTPRVDGTVDIGPNAVLALAREGYSWRRASLADLRQMAAWPGFRRMARTHWRAGMFELRGSLLRSAFIARAREYVPELETADVVVAPAGVRAQAVDRDGTLVDDFVLRTVGRVVTVRNAPSPAATSSLAIAERIVSYVKEAASA
jgi:L-2-hydroxyglutarate oxidase LhgO